MAFDFLFAHYAITPVRSHHRNLDFIRAEIGREHLGGRAGGRKG
jgi:hypothetical protein